MNIEKIAICVLTICVIYLFIQLQDTKEKMTNTDISKLDISAIKSLSDISQALLNGGLTIPGDVTIKGKLKIEGSLDIPEIKTGKFETKELTATNIKGDNCDVKEIKATNLNLTSIKATSIAAKIGHFTVAVAAPQSHADDFWDYKTKDTAKNDLKRLKDNNLTWPQL